MSCSSSVKWPPGRGPPPPVGRRSSTSGPAKGNCAWSPLTYRCAKARYLEWFDLPVDQVLGRTIQDLVGFSDFQTRAPFLAQALRGEPARFDLSWPRRDGRRRIADVRYTPRRDDAGQVDGFYVFVQDVTVQRDAEALLAAENRSLSQEVTARTAERNRLWETTNDLMGTAGFDGYLKAVNPAWTTLLGWSEEELLDRPFVDLIEPADHAETAAVVERLMAGRTITDFVDHVLAKTGRSRAIMWTAVPDPGTDLFYVVGKDLTEQRHAEEALRQSQKMEAVGQRPRRRGAGSRMSGVLDFARQVAAGHRF